MIWAEAAEREAQEKSRLAAVSNRWDEVVEMIDNGS